MTSRFLSGNSTDLSALQDGSFALNVASAAVADLAPGLPVRVGLDHSLVSGQITVADCAFTPSTNPATSDLDIAGHKITGIDEAVFNQNSAPATVPFGQIGVYADTGRLYTMTGSTPAAVATLTDLGSYLPRSGGTMTGSIDMITNNLMNVGTISGATNSRTADNIVSSNANGVAGNLPTWSGTAKVLQESGVPLNSLATTAALNNYLPTAGGTMTGAVAMGGNPITGVVNLVLPNSVPGTVAAGNTLLYSSSDRPRYKDSTGTSYQLSNSVELKSYLPLAGGPMTGNIDMGNNQITNCSLMSFPLGGQISGPTNTRTADNIVSNTGAAVLGNLAVFSSSSGKTIAESGVTAANVVSNLGGGTTAGQVATWNGTTGRFITNSSTPILGTPASGTLTNCVGLPIASGVSGLGTGVATMLGTFNHTNIYNAAYPWVAGNGGYLVFSTQPDFIGATQRFQPLKVSTLTQYDAFTPDPALNPTNAPTSFISAASIGTRFWAANTTNTGMVIKATANAQINSWSAGGTLTISLYVNGTACVNLVVPTGAVTYIRADFDLTIRSGTASRGQGALLASGQLPVLSDGNATWTKTNSNNVDIMFKWSVGSSGNIISPLSASIETHYQNS